MKPPVAMRGEKMRKDSHLVSVRHEDRSRDRGDSCRCIEFVKDSDSQQMICIWLHASTFDECYLVLIKSAEDELETESE